MDMIPEEYHLVQRLQQEFLELIYQSPLTKSKQEAGMATPPAHTIQNKQTEL